MIRDYLEDKPLIDESVFVAKSADIIGNVKIGKDSSLWYNAVVRGDEGPISIGENTNIQDCSIVHGDADTIIGNNVTVGHRSIVHGCKISDNVLIGMGSIILDNAEIGEYTLIGAGTLITSNKKFPPGVLIMGSPGKVVRELTEEDKRYIDESYKWYLEAAQNQKY